MLKDLYKQIVEKLTKRYRIEFIHDETLYQSRVLVLKPIKAIVIIGLAIILIIGGTASLIVFTPGIRKHIPGYHNPEYDQTLDALIAQIEELERTRAAQESVLQSLQQFAGLNPDEVALAAETDGGQAKKIPLQQENTQSANAENQASVAQKPASLPVTRTYQANPGQIPTVNAVNEVGLVHLFSPLKGEIRKKFDEEEPHYGIDIVANENELIRAATDGFVILKEYSEENGHVIGIASLQYDIVTFYKHNSNTLKEVGQYVKAGEAVAVIGNSGENSSGPHLHFEVWFQGKPQDPQIYRSFE